jgi:hypothetical protein
MSRPALPGDAELRDRVRSLDLAPKIRLLTGADLWRLPVEPRLGLSAVTMSDGPQGIRGTGDDPDETGLLAPAPSALAAAWDADLAERLGELFATEARREGVDVVLAPVVNLQRTPVAGRHFDYFSEDPLLTGTLAAAVVRGLQSRGVGACLKHFVANDSESDRTEYRPAGRADAAGGLPGPFRAGPGRGRAVECDGRVLEPGGRDGSKALITYDSSLLARQPQVRIGDQWLGYTLPTGASLAPPTGEVALPRDSWQASASASSSDDPPAKAIDSDAATRWSSGHGMQPGDWFQLDLGSTQTFNQLVLDTSASSGDFARQYEVYTSDDGTTWGKPMATGPGSAVTRILLPTTTARYIRVVNKANSGSWWSIHDLSVLSLDGKVISNADVTKGVQRKSAQLPDGTRLSAAYNSGSGTAAFDFRWGGTTYSYRLPAGAAAIFTTRSA